MVKHSHHVSVDRDRAERNTKIVMLLTAVTMVAEIVVALVVNLASALLLQGHHHSHDHHHHHHQDYNLRALHSCFSRCTNFYSCNFCINSPRILGINVDRSGNGLNWCSSDYEMVLRFGLRNKLDFARSNCRSTNKLAIVNAIEEDSNNSVSDLHVWKIGQDRISAMVSLLSDRPQQPEYYKNCSQVFHLFLIYLLRWLSRS